MVIHITIHIAKYPPPLQDHVASGSRRAAFESFLELGMMAVFEIFFPGTQNDGCL